VICGSNKSEALSVQKDVCQIGGKVICMWCISALQSGRGKWFFFVGMPLHPRKQE